MKRTYTLPGILAGLLLPGTTQAQGMIDIASSNPMVATFVLFVVVVLAIFLTKAAVGVMNVSFIKKVPLSKLEQEKPHLPSPKVILGAVLMTGVVLISGVEALEYILGSQFASISSLLYLFGFLSFLALVAQLRWKAARECTFAIAVGSAIAWSLLQFHGMLFKGGQQDPFFFAFVVVCVGIAWRCLFGPWKSDIKAIVLGTFIGWVLLSLIVNQSDADRAVYLLTIGIALLPTAVWISLFMRYHRQRWSSTLLMFFAGTLSTAPILFYDALVKNDVELNFFLFRVVPENFSRNSTLFVSSGVMDGVDIPSAVATLFLSFVFVGFIEELSKYWVTRRGGEQFFSSIVDVMQMAIIVAIGFACAENILNPSYFQGFLRMYILMPPEPQWLKFIANIAGRSILTNMVHIVSTGIMGYFLGVALFARTYILEARKNGHRLRWLYFLNYVLKVPQKIIFERTMLIVGIVIPTIVHGFFNFSVSIPSSLPGNPQTIGALFQLNPSHVLSGIPVLMVPSVLYVVGGYWLISYLLSKKESQEERGVRIVTDTFVRERTLVEA